MATAASPQPNVLSENLGHGNFLIVHLDYGADPREVLKICAHFVLHCAELLPFKVAQDHLPIVGVGFSKALLTRFCQENSATSFSMPENFRDYVARKAPLVGTDGMPATGGDIFLHVKSRSRDVCFEVGRLFMMVLPREAIANVLEIHGMNYFGSRDLTGFVDGTANPKPPRRPIVATMPSEGSNVGGSFSLTQKWVHNLSRFHALSIPEQENVIGRTKLDSIELTDKPPSSHVSRVDVPGAKIFRQSMPFGTGSGDHGLFFLAFSSSIEKFDVQLDRMAGIGKEGEQQGVFDSLLKFSRCETGQYFYFPSLKEIEDFSMLTTNVRPHHSKI